MVTLLLLGGLSVKAYIFHRSQTPRDSVAGLVRKGVYTVRQDGVILADGQPFFPFGFYHTSWMTDTSGAKRRGQAWLNDLNLMADSGFNFVHPTFDFGQENHDFAKLAQQRNMKEIPFEYTFQANRKYRIKIEYYDQSNGAKMRLYWKHEKIRHTIIPEHYFRVYL